MNRGGGRGGWRGGRGGGSGGRGGYGGLDIPEGMVINYQETPLYPVTSILAINMHYANIHSRHLISFILNNPQNKNWTFTR
jgi:hypothetical protein